MRKRAAALILAIAIAASPGCVTVAVWDDFGAAKSRHSIATKAAVTVPLLVSEALFLGAALALDFVIPPLSWELVLGYFKGAERALNLHALEPK